MLARSSYVYGGPLRDAIHALKYRGHQALAAPLGRLLAASAPLDVLAGVAAVVPVPLHPRRQACRGFNQAELLARAVAGAAGAPLVTSALRRMSQELSQAELRAPDRQRNVASAFAPGRVVLSGTVLLVDDVFSTGATADACATALRAAGADWVMVLTLARAVLNGRHGEAPTMGGRQAMAPR
jgi:ComF family protein